MRQVTGNHDQQPMGNGRMKGTETTNSVPRHSHQPDIRKKMANDRLLALYGSPTCGKQTWEYEQPREDETKSLVINGHQTVEKRRMR